MLLKDIEGENNGFQSRYNNHTRFTGIAISRLKDAEILAQSQSYDGAIYLCGYAIELGLKYRICKTLNWVGYPSTRRAFQHFQSFRTHNLEVLLHLTGIEDHVLSELFAEWSIAANWTPEMRYNPIGTAAQEDADLLISSAKELLDVLCKK